PSPTSGPFAGGAPADATRSTPASAHPRRRRRRRDRDSQTRTIPNASAPTRAAAGTPGGSTPRTRSDQFASSGVSEDKTPSKPTDAAPIASSDSGVTLGQRPRRI